MGAFTLFSYGEEAERSLWSICHAFTVAVGSAWRRNEETRPTMKSYQASFSASSQFSQESMPQKVLMLLQRYCIIVLLYFLAAITITSST